MVALMRIGLISDVHANLPALQAVLAAMGDVNQILCAGDLVGYYAEPNEVCSLIRDIGAVCIRGNHDAYVTAALVPNSDRREDYRTDWTRETLSEDNFRWLEALPTELSLSVDGLTIKMRHASPWDEETYLYPDAKATGDVKLDRDEFLVVGHTHRPMVVQAGEGLLINPGSVGQPRDYNPDASFAILDAQARCIVHRRVRYDVDAYQRRLKQLGWGEGPRLMLSRLR